MQIRLELHRFVKPGAWGAGAVWRATFIQLRWMFFLGPSLNAKDLNTLFEAIAFLELRRRFFLWLSLDAKNVTSKPMEREEFKHTV